MLAHGYRVRALDSLVAQVHEDGSSDLPDEVELIEGDVRDADPLRRALGGVDSVVHLAARVGVGQSMYEIAEYTSANSLATAQLMEVLAERPVRKLVVASSMSIYGEGAYSGPHPGERTREMLERHEWDFPGLEPLPTPETKRPVLSSIYALTKYDQERACLVAGAAYGIPT
ncbi:MAG TPA: NAD-dependent epimerase/dehydratase family protein, partial [Gaiellaceae bacterium]|nr:NAD-dependent epimerase/dehydratase family protein [Gaiellaceae bacterium]